MHILPNKFKAIIIACLASLSAYSQAGHFLPAEELRMPMEEILLDDGLRDHLSVRPFALRDIKPPVYRNNADSLLLLFFSDSVQKGVLSASVSPLLLAGAGYSNKADGLYHIGPGAAISLDYGKKWSLYTDFFLGAERFPAYLQEFIDSTGVLPSLGEDRADLGDPSFAVPTARLSYAPTENFQFELGYGRNFLGQGYRSLFLSDVAFNYPYLKIETDVWNIKYINIYSALQGSRGGTNPNADFEQKFSTTHYLSWAISPRFNLGLFETIVWQGQDTLSNRGFDPNYLNPIIFYRPVEYSVGSPDNALIGLDLAYKISNKTAVYGQLLFDEFLLSAFRERNGWWGNKWGAQIGVKAFDAFGIDGLRLRAEFNTARPFTYTHGSVLQNFGHYNQPLAHPLGANFHEGLLDVYYEKNRIFVNGFFMYAVYGRDPDSLNLGGDIFRSYVNPASEFDNETGQGIGSELYFQRLGGGYILDRKRNLRAGISYTLRHLKMQGFSSETEHIFGISLSTSLYNSYREF